MGALPEVGDEQTKGEAFAKLSAALIGAHAEASAKPGRWAKRDAHYRHQVAWLRQGDKHTLVLQGVLTPDLNDRACVELALPSHLRLLAVQIDYEKKRATFALERLYPEPEPAHVLPSTPRMDRAGEHLSVPHA